jgi:hypothetical protein
MREAAAADTRSRFVRDAVRELIRRGFRPIPIPARSKAPVLAGWPTLEITEATVDSYFDETMNVGVRNGDLPQFGRALCDTDLDCDEAIRCAPRRLPATSCRHGRASAPDSHWFYLTDAACESKKYVDPVDHKVTLIERRANAKNGEALQTVWPPSIHPEGEAYAATATGDPAIVSAAELIAAHNDVAAVAIVARRMSEGIRHEINLAFCGTGLHGGLPLERVEVLAAMLADAAGCPQRADEFVRAARDTHKAIEADRPATGAGKLAELLGQDGKAVVAKLREWLVLRGTREEDVPRLRVVNIAELITAELRPRECILSQIFFTQSLNMVFARRGIGKSLFVMGGGYAVAGGGTFLRYRADRPRRVLLVDGEMPAVLQRERFAAHIDAADFEADPDFFRIITPDLQDRSLPDLATRIGQAAIEEHLGDVELLILDNLSALVRTGVENDAESWLPIQEWALGLRRRGVVVLFVHHAGQSGNQRGTSKREDLLDTVIELRRPRDYDTTQGARFEVHLTKARGIHGPDAEPFEAALVTGGDGKPTWTVRSMEERLTAQVAEMVREGETYREIAKTLGTTKSTVERHARKAREQGIL